MKNKITILICDDDKTDITLFKKYLAFRGLKKYDLLEAADPGGLNKLLNSKKNSIDLVFLDYYLGAYNGLELLKEIRRTHKVPVIMLTGRGDEELAVECMKEGAVDYLPKDSLPEVDLAKTIERAIDKWEIENERNQLLGIAAHELRNPLAVILGYTEMLKSSEEIDDEMKKMIFEVIHERSNHLLTIINELLDITRIDKGIISLKKKRSSLTELITKKVKDYQFIAAKKNIGISFSTPPDNIIAEIDQDKIEEVVSNLLDNAIKYSPRGKTVKVTLEKTDSKIIITIADQGLGIKESELKYLFQLFSSKKINTLPTGKESRTGLGLAISKKVIDAHNGEILVKSEVGEGSTFTIVLPADNSQRFSIKSS